MAIALKNLLGIKSPSAMFNAFGNCGIQDYVEQAVNYETKRVTFNHICQAGYGLDAQDTNRLYRIAQKLGAQQGYSSTHTIEAFSSALASRSLLRLDSFGLSARGIRERVKSLQSVGMSDNQAFIQALLNSDNSSYQIIDCGNGFGLVLSSFGGGFIVPTMTYGESLTSLTNQVEDLKIEIGKAFLPVIDSWVKCILEPRIGNKPQYVLSNFER